MQLILSDYYDGFMLDVCEQEYITLVMQGMLGMKWQPTDYKKSNVGNTGFTTISYHSKGICVHCQDKSTWFVKNTQTVNLNSSLEIKFC